MKKILSMFLALCMIVTMLPVTAMAEEKHTTIGGSGEIISFSPLTETAKSVSLGIAVEDLGLPETVTAMVRTAVSIGEDSGSPETATPTTATELEWKETTVDISVKWKSTPEYDMGAEGEYVFIPVIEDYAVNIELPEIIVTVATAIMGRGLLAPLELDTYNIWVGGVQVTSDNESNVLGDEGATVTYTPATGNTAQTLTLNGANIANSYSWDNKVAGIYAIGDLNIILNGENSITAANNDNGYSSGIHFDGTPETLATLTISGDGSLHTKGGDISKNINFQSSGIYGQNIIIDSGIVVAESGITTGSALGIGIASNAYITINGGNITAIGNASGYQSNGMRTHSCTINGGTITARAGDAYYSFGVYYQNDLIIKGGNLSVQAGNADSLSYGINVNANSLMVSGGGIIARGNTKGIGASQYNPRELSFSNVTISGGEDEDTLSPITDPESFRTEAYKYVKIEPAPANTDVAQIGSTSYITLQAAFDSVTDGETIKLLDDIDLADTVTSSGNTNNFSLDLNGKTLNSGSNIAIKHSGTGTLTIKDTGTDGKITSKADINSYGTIDLRGGILAVEGGTIENTLNDDDANAILKDHNFNGAIIVTGGTIISTEGTAIYYGYIPSSSDPTIPSGILIPSGTPIIKGGLTAMNMASDLSSYTNVKVTASTNYDGSEPVTYNADNYYNYKYLKFEPGSTPTFLTGSATISNTSPRIGDVLKGSIVDGNNTGTLTYIWKADETQVGTGINYTVAETDLSKTITLEISSSIETGTITSTPTMAVLKKVDPSSPAAPILSSKTHNTVTLTANIGYQFSKDGTTWQTSNVFSGLTASTTYIFYQRIAETNDTEASAASTGLSVTTNSNSGGGDSGSSGGSSDSSGGSGSGGNDGGSSSNDNSSPVIVIPPPPDKPNDPTQGEIKVPGTADGKGNITVNITNKTVTDAFNKALADAKKNGNEQNGITVVLRVDTGSKTGSNVTVNLPKTVQDTIIAKKIVNTIVVVDNPDIRIGMDLATVQEINKQAKSDVNITANRRDSDKLTGDGKKAIGSRPVFDLKVNYDSSKQVQSFGAGSVSVTIPYTLGTNEKAENVQAVYVDDNEKLHWLENSVYDSAEKVLRFSTNHFSTYGVGYKEDAPAFTDIATHWAKEDIEFVVSSGLFSGTSATTFSPNTAMTRGMFVTALGRLANADVSVYTESSFTDVKSDAYYMGYIEWASKNSIVKGTGNGRFAPDQSITREQMAVIMENYAKVIGFTIPKAHGENTFADSSKISTYAKDAVKQMQMAGVISGKNGNLFDPQGTATRAEVSAVLRRIMSKMQ